jgi:hypothetical protein
MDMFRNPLDADPTKMTVHRMAMILPELRACGTTLLAKEAIEDALTRRNPGLLPAADPLGIRGNCSVLLPAISSSP